MCEIINQLVIAYLPCSSPSDDFKLRFPHEFNSNVYLTFQIQTLFIIVFLMSH